MNSKESEQKDIEGNGGFNAIVGVYLVGIVCCLAGPVALLAGVAGLKTWFNGLHPFVVALFTVVAVAFAIVWITRLRHRRRLARGEAARSDSVDIATKKTYASRS
jgi:Flp pilus assembly protein TadB